MISASRLTSLLKRLRLQTKFHVVVAGDTCYKVIGDSGDLDEFYDNNPAVDADCSNLEIGVA